MTVVDSGQGRVQFTEGVPKPALQNDLSIVIALRCRGIRRDVRPMRDLPPKLPQPLKGGVFDVRFVEGGHGLTALLVRYQYR